MGEENLDVSIPDRREDSLGSSSGIYERPHFPGDVETNLVIFRPSVHLLHRPPLEQQQQQPSVLRPAVRGK